MAKFERIKVAVLMRDGTEHEVMVANPDLTRWETTRQLHNWPTSAEAPILMTTFLAWHALKRTGVYDGKFETFRDDDVELVEDVESEPVDPTQSAAGADSA